jgi:hypothetical protein
VVIGCGIAAMHYIGMAAMRLPARLEWQSGMVAISVIIAVAVSAVALRLAFRHGHEESQSWGWRKVLSAVVMGFAIFSMHYTGMAAIHYAPVTMMPSTSWSVSIPWLGAWAIAAATGSVLAAAIASSILDRYVSAQTRHLHRMVAEVRTLRGLLSICAECKRIRTDEGEWERIESYVRTRTEAEFSHGLCPSCEARWHELHPPPA